MNRRLGSAAAVALAGAAQLGVSLTSEPGSPRFYGYTTGVAATWVLGGALTGPVPLGSRSVLRPAALGAGAFAAFYGCALVARRVPPLRRALRSVLRYAHEGSGPGVLATALANGAAEEVFFRGALYGVLADRRPVITSTAVYALVTCATGNPALVLASVPMGLLLACQRRSTGGVTASVITHVTWSALMLTLLPPLFDNSHDRGCAPPPERSVAVGVTA